MWFVRWRFWVGDGWLSTQVERRTRAEARAFAKAIRAPYREQICVSFWYLGDTTG